MKQASSVSNFSVAGSEVTVNLSSITNAQTIVITLADVSNGSSTNDVSASMSVIIGDTTGSGNVNSSDLLQVKSQSGQSVTSTNFRTDVTGNGLINSSDITLVQSKSGTGLP